MIKDISSKAKPCPMCGSKRIYVDKLTYNAMFSVKIYCADCGLSGYKNFTNKAKNPIEKTIDYWNTRVYVIESKNGVCPWIRGKKNE